MAHADLLLEVDFQTYNAADRLLTAIVSKPGASPSLVVSENGAVVDPEAATEIQSSNPKLLKGLGECLTAPGGGGCFQTSAGAAASYSRYLDAERGYGTATIVTIFKPNFGGPLSGVGTNRACLFTTNYRGTSESGIILAVTKELTIGFGIGSASSAKKRLSVPQPDWDPSKWYFIAASWSPQQKPTIYWRELPSDKGEFSISADDLTDTSEAINRGIRLGNIGTNDGSLQADAPMNGKMAYFLITDTYTSSAEAYDALYHEVVNSK